MLLKYNQEKSNYNYSNCENDKGDLTQAIIIIAGFAVASIIGIGGITTVVMEKGEDTANCIAKQSAFSASAGADFKNDCNTKLEVDKNLTVNESIINEDLIRFSELAEKFNKDNDRYPVNSELNSLKYTATHSAYPQDFDWNFDYCSNTDRSEYIITVHTSPRTIMYVSSNNTTPVKYRAGVDLGPDRGVSPCYSDVPYSAADHAGLGKIGVLDINGEVVANSGLSGLGSTGWRTWTSGGA